jgi:hypothetical protein
LVHLVLVLPDNTDHDPTVWAVNPTAMGIQSLVDDETKKAFAEIQQKVGARRLALAVWLAVCACNEQLIVAPPCHHIAAHAVC